MHSLVRTPAPRIFQRLFSTLERRNRRHSTLTAMLKADDWSSRNSLRLVMIGHSSAATVKPRHPNHVSKLSQFGTAMIGAGFSCHPQIEDKKAKRQSE
jgi:hypothetical protein